MKFIKTTLVKGRRLDKVICAVEAEEKTVVTVEDGSLTVVMNFIDFVALLESI